MPQPQHVEIALNPEALLWFKVAGWLAISGGATWVIARIWEKEKKRKDWEQTSRIAKARERRK